MSDGSGRPKCDFNVRLRALWKASGVSQGEFADAIGHNVRTVRGWLDGPNRPDYETLILIADFLEVTVDELLRDLTPAARARLILRLDLPALADHLDCVSKAVNEAHDLIERTRIDQSIGVNLDAVSRAAVGLMRDNGFRVTVAPAGDGFRATARDKRGAEFHADGAEVYPVLCKLAVAVGIDLDDG
jgi:transcriptional regulator with XRE-family HTH domain